jgi:TRAP-type C4-dicarboxylate transport system permease small subunit
MEWQTVVAVLVAVGCAGWVGWRVMRPFVRRESPATKTSAAGSWNGELIDISPIDKND